MLRNLVFVVALIFPATGIAQTRDTTPVQRDVVIALLQGLSMGQVDAITVGAFPAGYPREIVPPGAKILGGVDFGDAAPAGRSDLLIVELDATPDSAFARIDAHLTRAGWTTPTFPHRQRGGFVSVSFGAGGFGKMFCRDNRLIHTRALPTERGSLLTISLSDSRRSMCDERERRRMAGHEPEIELPTLTPPTGVRMGGGGSGGGTGYRESTARVLASRSSSFLLDHFAAQLKQQGWQSHGQVSTPHTSALILTKHDKDGRLLQGTLMTTPLGTNEQDVAFRVVVPADRDF